MHHHRAQVADTFCSGLGSKPMQEQACNEAACVSYRWETCAFEPCTALCNGGGQGIGMMGFRYRNIFCLRDIDNKRVDESLCPTAKEYTYIEGCNTQPCDANNWMTTEWSACRDIDAETGLGTRTRKTHCHFKDGCGALFSNERMNE